ncbi:MAG: transporter substrate-binding domain-containing protein [Clostridia bacterium]|nr:transporter substrate-binding domain-containing protein [Clostridia bacterium]
MKKKVLIALLVIAIVCVSCMAFAGCDNRVKVGFQSGTTGQFYTEDLKNLNPSQYPNATLAVKDMIEGRISYVITDIAPAKAIAAQFADQVKVIDIGLTEEEYCFAINPNDTKGIEEKLNKFMNDHKEELQVLQNAYVQGTNEKKVIYSATNPTNPLKVATSPDFPPFENVSGDGFEGYDLEVMDMFCKEYGFDLVINSMDFDSIVLNVGNGQSDVGAAALTWNEDRAKSVKFSASYYDATQVVICLKSDTTFDNCKTKEDVEAILAAL